MADSPKDLQAAAKQYGLPYFNDTLLAQLARAKEAATQMVNGIPRNLHAYDEPAHIYRASEEVSA